MRWVMALNGFGCRAVKCSDCRERSCAISFMSASIWERRPRVAGRKLLIGGAELYQDGLKLADTLYITEVHEAVEGDAHFPQWDSRQWREVSRERHTSVKGLPFSYVTYQRA